MARVAALYRYPVKGFTPDSPSSLTVDQKGRIAGDRVLAFRMASATPTDGWASKVNFVVLMNTPGLARLKLHYDHEACHLHISHSGATLVEGGLDEIGRACLATAVGQYVLGLAESPLLGHLDRLPLRLVGDGKTPLFHDSRENRVTLHGRGSLASLGAALGDDALDEQRFRTNISVDGLKPWEELGWQGRCVRIGKLGFSVVRPLIRCLATHANPLTGERDQNILTTLTRGLSQKHPTFGISLALDGPGGPLHVGDEVTVLSRSGT